MKPLRLILAALILASPLLAQNENGVSLTIRFAESRRSREETRFRFPKVDQTRNRI
jgi:hypothetical protein